MKKAVVLIAVSAACGCSFDEKSRVVRYPDVYFQQWNGSHFRSVKWSAGVQRMPCKLVVRLPAGDLGANELADPEWLRHAGWLEATDAGRRRLWSQPPPALVECVYESGELVEVCITTSNEADRVEVGVGGRWIALPATYEDITRALGPPPTSE